MGVDADIFFEMIESDAHYLPHTFGWDISECDDEDLREHHGITHELSSGQRYYGDHFSGNYYRGFWPEICAVLLSLLAHKSVGKVVYGGDCGTMFYDVNIEMIEDLTRKWVSFGQSYYGSGRDYIGNHGRTNNVRH
jgi:hypothetical protein